MPVYEYECPQCGTVFEEWGKAAESHKEEPCPSCGAPSPRIISRTSFVLKGEGWYVSDYGYRKGISEDGGAKEGSVPAVSGKTAPAVKDAGTVAVKETGDKAASPAKAAPASSAAASTSGN